MKQQVSLSIDGKVWKEAKTKAEKEDVHVSQKVQDFLENWAEMETSASPERSRLLPKSNLTQLQRQLVIALIEHGKGEIELPAVNKIAKKEGIYFRKDYVQEAVHKISADSKVPYKLKDDNSTLKVQDFDCYCGAQIFPSALSKTDGKCPSCDTPLFQLEDPAGGIDLTK